MPGGDRTGPRGMGPMTGRGVGFCAGFGVPGYANPVPARGWGLGFGRGFHRGGLGCRNRYYLTGIPGWAWFGSRMAPFGYPTPDTERQVLERQVQLLESEMKAMKKRLEELDAANETQ